MEIKISKSKFAITIEEEANINDTLDGIVAALKLEGFMDKTIYEGLKGKAESMDNEYGFSEGD